MNETDFDIECMDGSVIGNIEQIKKQLKLEEQES